MRLTKVPFLVVLVVFISVVLPLNAFAEERTLSILFFSSFQKANDEDLVKLANEFAKKNNVKVVVDFISIPEMAAKLTSEVMAGKGHDIIGFENLQVALHKDNVVSLDDVVEEITSQYGEFDKVMKDVCFHDGHWKALPWWTVPFHGLYRRDYLEEVGASSPETWYDLLSISKKLKANGHPVGLAISSCWDSNNWLYPLLLSFGAKIVDENGKILIDSEETRKALNYVKELYQEGMASDVLAWDNSGNNTFILSGVGSWTMNPLSIYIVAERENPELARNIYTQLVPAGEEGRFGSGDIYGFMVWEFSENVDLAKEFLKYIYEENNFISYLEDGQGHNIPPLSYFREPIWERDERVDEIIDFPLYQHYFGWPAPPDERIQEVGVRFLVPTMFAQVVTGSLSVDEAIGEMVNSLVEIGYEE